MFIRKLVLAIGALATCAILVGGGCWKQLIIDDPVDPDGSTTVEAGPQACSGGCPENLVCSKGICTDKCGLAELKCGAGCVDSKTDNDNCGKCGTKCQTSYKC